ncbi:cytochrome c maturation protein CcmE [Calderihabitans maritimus]|uniref:Cytochrome c-type biogenesis protein CcmE n=1 Tax=Calderihabitans maritimus TaxID=1246530 RepID=A0A1Z5HRK2_9FIRM|nr:cytochrome c maturation protein CcmE [Calderihabitans maritimus]GAW92156.1 hypothetical protein KKC1_13150 [Calderihabitans maritimus]
MTKGKKMTIGILIVVLAVGYLIVSGFSLNSGYQVTISELLENPEAYEGKYIVTEGKLDQSSVQWDSQKIELRFKVFQEDTTMPVVYNGVMPDNFDYPEADIILQGYYNSKSGIFEAEKVSTRCPSKYEAAEEEK